MGVWIPVARVVQHCWNPLAKPPWPDIPKKTGRFVDLVDRAISRGSLVSWQWSDLCTPDWTDYQHAQRVAFLVLNQSSSPIEIDVGCPSLGYSIPPYQRLTDGNHRLAAAQYRGDQMVFASVSGELDFAEKLFGVDCTEPEAEPQK